ncbi:hypothetical protein FQN54_005658 [Arachnomyces sp. PD_36]|nr:hypothetical protein FQN54_005658 [Arachnomyces sp. PD_36]
MGNLCSRSANQPDPFAQPGRVLGTSPSTQNQPSRAPVPQKIDSKNKARVGGPPRTLGGGAGGEGEARSAAAKAAEERARKQSASNTGKLSSQLAAQKSQTRTGTLEQVSREERGARDADAASQARRWD